MRSSGLSRFGAGLRVPLDGFAYMRRHPGLWRYAFIPILLNVLITFVVLLILVGTAIWFVNWMHPRFSPRWWGMLLEVVAAIAVFAVAVLLAMGAWVLLNGILCGHFYTKLAREVELTLGTSPSELRDVSFAYQIVDAFRDFATLLTINIGLLALNIVPVIGSLIGVALAVYLDAFVLGRDHLDFPMSLRGIRRADKLATCRKHRAETVGPGTSVFLFNLIPVAGSVFLATAAAGSVLMYKRWREEAAESHGFTAPGTEPTR